MHTNWRHGHPRLCGRRLPGYQRAPSRQPARRGRTKSGLECEGDGIPTPGSAGANSSPESQVSAIHLPDTFCEGLLRALHHQDEKVTTQTDLMCCKCLRKRAIPSICDRTCKRNTENEK